MFLHGLDADVELLGDLAVLQSGLPAQQKDAPALLGELRYAVVDLVPKPRKVELPFAAVGDQAADIAEMAHFVSESGCAGKVHIEEMAVATIKMVTESIDSFVKADILLAKKVMKDDDVVDDLFLTVKNELIESVIGDKKNAEALIDLLMIAKYLERIGDHAVNIAEWVVYSLTGKK